MTRTIPLFGWVSHRSDVRAPAGLSRLRASIAAPLTGTGLSGAPGPSPEGPGNQRRHIRDTNRQPAGLAWAARLAHAEQQLNQNGTPQ